MISLPTAAPFRLDLTAWALRRREKNSVDGWDGRRYTRVIAVGSRPVRLTVTHETSGAEPVLTVGLHAEVGDRAREETRLLVTKILGLTGSVRRTVRRVIPSA